MSKSWKLLIVSLVLCLFFTAGCAADGPDESRRYPVVLDVTNDEEYQWTYTIEDESVLTITKEEDSDEASPLGHSHIFGVQPLEVGQTTIHFAYGKSGDDDVLYNYSATYAVDKELFVDQVSQSGDYIALQKFMSLGEEKLQLEKPFSEYKMIFNDDVVNVGEDECSWLVVYDEGEMVASYAISNSNDHIYLNDDGERVLIK